MKQLSLLPQPKKQVTGAGWFAIPASGVIGIPDWSFGEEANLAKETFPGHQISILVPSLCHTLVIDHDANITRDGYDLCIGTDGVRIRSSTRAGVFYALQTLHQIAIQSPRGRLPKVFISDWPDFSDRGIYYDVARGRVPKLESLIEQVKLLSHFKINHFQLYIEHTFAFRRHPLIGRRASPLTAEDILALDKVCRERHIELVPSLATFGHMATVLKHPQYHALAEDWGIGKYCAPEARNLRVRKGWSLAPANPRVYEFLDSLFAELLPLFSSPRFNVCCDETYDLGMGQSYALCRRRGKGRLYLDHICRLRDLAAKYGKKIMFWGDIIRQYPELIPQIPRDVTVLDWGYQHNIDFDKVRDFKRAGLEFFACPGTSSWVALFPRVHEAAANIHGFARAARKYGGRGLLTTDWGDGGHYNFMENSWHGYCFGAEQAWNVAADRATFTARFARLFLNCSRRDLISAIEQLGDVAHTSIDGYYQSVWQHLFFAPATSELFTPRKRTGWVATRGAIARKTIVLDAAFAHRVLYRLERVRATLLKAQRTPGSDPHRVLPYWIFAVDAMTHAAHKLAILAASKRPAARQISALHNEMEKLLARFQRLWLDRNRPSELRITVSRYRRAMRTYAQLTPRPPVPTLPAKDA